MKWNNKEKLFALINKYEKNGVIFLSGDVHFAQIYHSNCYSLTGYDIYEYTSSGMTHNSDIMGVGTEVVEIISS